MSGTTLLMIFVFLLGFGAGWKIGGMLAYELGVLHGRKQACEEAEKG